MAAISAWHRQVLVLLLAQPRHVVRDVDPKTRGVRLVGTSAVVHASRVVQDRTPTHLRRLGIFDPVGHAIVGLVAADDHPGGTVLGGEIREGPDGIALHFVSPGEGKEIKRPLIAMDRLGRLTGSDGDGLGQMQLEIAGMLQHQSGHPEGHWMEHQVATGGTSER